ncbi:Glycosyl hydrolase family 38 - alpha-mannosidase [Klebsormidium nitens]|uniref:Alpha-mannosidase n=1 Tax=Klebsormidium nitens TaxID=105231 RepID=A0A1Y1HIH9_KLENI|nr:Glycosyl hydrolase family 38 - alpha-mannosidase [Klebsormidium nitens]|eukprot:GAQ77673.1 Glycosyl hydrolase family 38 - alpha-mannosidase [Klebsormidium nitens]
MAVPGRGNGLRSRPRGFGRLLVVAGLFLLVPIFTFVAIELAGELRTSPLPHLHDFYHGFTEGEESDPFPHGEKLQVQDGALESPIGGDAAPKLKNKVGDVPEFAFQQIGGLGELVKEQYNDLMRDRPATRTAVDAQEPGCTFALGVDRTENITTKRLYDEIAFKNEEGGVWRQGWPITYKGSEWDKRKLRVFVVPHSHNDPGWIRTVEEYYNERTFNILNVIVQALKADSRRKFIWEEMSYLSMWWSDGRVTQAQRDDFTWLVQTGQLEIVGGGWVMNDEANAHHFAIVDQMIEGHAWIANHLGPAALPRTAWAIDPFGHSPSMAYINKRAGFESMLIQRTHYEVKKKLALTRDLEFVWRQAWDPAETTDIVTHMMPFYSYDVPHTCGPDPAVCCQFDFLRLPRSGSTISCPWNIAPEEVNEHNVKERAELILDQWRKKSMLFRTNAVLIPLGDDFRYQSQLEAELQYNNYQAIFDHINRQADLHVEAQWGTLRDYFQALREELAADSPLDVPMQSDTLLPAPGSLSVLSGDFFTYADRMQDYWSGYYVSRPFYKSVDRVLEETLRAAEILFTLSAPQCARGSLDPLHAHLVRARRSLAVFQHHDGVTGTAKDHVAADYGEKMHVALKGLQTLMAALLPLRLAPAGTLSLCRPDLESLFFIPEESRSAHHLLPKKRPVDVSRLGSRLVRIVLYNTLGEFTDQVFSTLVRLSSEDVCVLDGDKRPVDSQISPVWDVSGGGGLHRLHWRAQLPGLSLQTFFLAKGAANCRPAQRATVQVFNQEPGFECPAPYGCSAPRSLEYTISNEQLSVTVETVKGLVTHVTAPSPGVTSGQVTLIDEEFDAYYTQESGAYLFLPIGEAEEIVVAGGQVLVTEGPLFKEIHSKFRTTFPDRHPVVRSARLYAGRTVQGSLVEMHHHVAIGDAAFDDREFIVRYRTDVESGPVFHSDLNGLQMARRETFSKIPLQGNYYPMPALAFLQDSTRRFSVHTRQAVGVASLKPGWLEMMIDRRLVQDDNRGLGQGVTDNHPNEVVFHLTVEANVSLTGPLPQPWHPSLLSHRVTNRLAHTVHAFVGPPEDSEASEIGSKYNALPTCLPSDLEILNLKSMRPTKEAKTSVPGAALLLHRRGYDCSYGLGSLVGVADKPAKVVGADGLFQLDAMFAGFETKRVTRTSLTLMHDQPLEAGAGFGKTVARLLLGGGGEDDADVASAQGLSSRQDEQGREGTHRRSLQRVLGEGGSEDAVPGWGGSVRIGPMEIAAFKLNLVPRTS